MSVKGITTDDSRHINGKEGLVLQGCGGDLDEWVNGINDMMTKEGYLLEGSRFTDCAAFNHDGLTCLLFTFTDDLKVDIGKLALWRLQSHDTFGGTWLSDFVPISWVGSSPRSRRSKSPTALLSEQMAISLTLLVSLPAHCETTTSKTRPLR